MRILERDKQTIHYAAYEGKTEIMDGTKHTGAYTETYGTDQTAKMYVSPPLNNAEYQPYGISRKTMRRVIGQDLGIGLASVMRIITASSYDYVVKGVEKSFHHTTYLIEEL